MYSQEILRDLNVLEQKALHLDSEVSRLKVRGYTAIVGREERGERTYISFSDFFLTEHVGYGGHPMFGGGSHYFCLVNRNAGREYSAKLNDLEQYFVPFADVAIPPDESRTRYLEEWDMTLPERLIYDLFLYKFNQDNIRFLMHYLQLFSLPLDDYGLDWIHKCAEHIDELCDVDCSNRPIRFGLISLYEEREFSLAELHNTFSRIKHGNGIL